MTKIILCTSQNFDSSCHPRGHATNRLSCSEGGKVIHPLAAGVFDGEFTCREMLTKQKRMRGSNINPPCAQRIGRDWWNDMLTYPLGYRYRVSGIEGVDTIEYRLSDGIVRTLVGGYGDFCKLLDRLFFNLLSLHELR